MTSLISLQQQLNGSKLQNDAMWMREAIAQANIAKEKNEVPIGAVLIYENKIIGRGANQSIQNRDPTAHAEIMALREGAKTIGNYRLLDTTLYVTLEPCLMCVGALIHARIKRLVFGAYDPKAGAVKTKLQGLMLPFHNHRVDALGEVLSTDCGNLLSSFFTSRRRQNKSIKTSS